METSALAPRPLQPGMRLEIKFTVIIPIDKNLSNLFYPDKVKGFV